jgi:hypothetical protein
MLYRSYNPDRGFDKYLTQVKLNQSNMLSSYYFLKNIYCLEFIFFNIFNIQDFELIKLLKQLHGVKYFIFITNILK